MKHCWNWINCIVSSKKKKSIALESCSCRFQTPTASILMLSELWFPWSKYDINAWLYIGVRSQVDFFYVGVRSQLQCLGLKFTTLNFCYNIRHQTVAKFNIDSLEEWLPVMIDVGMFIIFLFRNDNAILFLHILIHFKGSL